MSVGNTKDQGNKGNNFPYQHKTLQLLAQIDKSINSIPGVDYVTRTTIYQATLAGPGYAISDILVRYDIIDVATSVVSSTIWFNQNTQLQIPTPVPGTYVPITPPSTVFVGNGAGGAAVNIQDGGNSITVDGVVGLDAPTLAALENINVDNGPGAAAVNIQDGGNSITVDGAVTAYQGGTWVLGNNTGVDIGDVTVNNTGGAGAVNIQDGGNSITVDDGGGSLTVNSTNLDIRNLTPSRDTVKVGDGTHTLAINPDGSTNITDNGGSLTVDSTNLDIRNLVPARDSVKISDGTDTLAVNADGSVNITDNGGSITVDGTVAATQSGSWSTIITDGVHNAEVTAAQALKVDGSGVTQPVSGTVTANQGGTWVLGTNTGVDIGDVTVNNAGGASAINIQDGGNVISIDDAGGSITVDGTVALDAATLTALEDVTIQNAGGASAVNIQDGGNSITVDDGGGSLTVDGTVTVVPSGTQDVNIVSTIAVPVTDNGGSLTVDATNLDIRNLLYATDKVDVSGSSVQVQDGTGTPITSTVVGSDTGLDVTLIVPANQTALPTAESGEALEALRQMQFDLEILKNTIGQARGDGSGRLRVLTDTTSTMATVTTVTTVSTVTNQTNIGGYTANDQVPSLRRLSADSLLSQITIS